MSDFTFKPAVRANVPLLIGLAGGTGSGKTMSALELAKGLSGGKRFAFIDTEAGRGLAYADKYEFDHGDMRPPFSPEAYAKAITAADSAQYPVIVVDSMSHEHAGDGGLLDWHENELERMSQGDWRKREALAMAAWIKPKLAHKQLVSQLLQLRAHLILCFRAEEKVAMERNQDSGKMEIVAKRGPGGFKGWLPVCEKNLPYELTASFLLMAEKPGIPTPIKLQEQHRALFPDGKAISSDAGKKLGEWARGGVAQDAPRADTPEITNFKVVLRDAEDKGVGRQTLAEALGYEGGSLNEWLVKEGPKALTRWLAANPTLTTDKLVSRAADKAQLALGA